MGWIVTRREFLRVSSLVGGGLCCGGVARSEMKTVQKKSKTRFGIVTDLHYAERTPLGNRYYRKSVGKLRECVGLMNAEKVDFLIEIGDFKDQASAPTEQSSLAYLDAIERVFCGFKGLRYHVLGNHDLDSISKKQFLQHIEDSHIAKAGYYSFDIGEVHFVVLDAAYKSDGSDYDHGNFDWKDSNIPPTELEWLKKELSATRLPTVVFVHQRLDGTGDVYVNNAAEVRNILKKSGNVKAVFQGHHHQGGYSLMDGIHYYTLKATVSGSKKEDNAYAIVELDEQNNITVTGYRKALDLPLP